ncbi:MAG: mechanosensitive ion channel family protein [Saprospiraceae bacterium]
MEQFNVYAEQFMHMLVEYAPKLVLALLLLLIGLSISNRLSDWASRVMAKRGVGDDIRPFLSSMLNVLLKVLLIFSVAEIVGIKTTSFVAMLAAVGFAVGLALQGSLSNFAAGVLILIFRPYRTGDLIQVNDFVGHVIEIQILNTIIATFDNKTVIIPNSVPISGIITNLSARKYLRVELKVAISITENFEKVQAILLEALRNTPKVLSDPAPFVGINHFNIHNMILDVQPYATVEDYWSVYYEAYRQVKKVLGEHNIQVMFPEEGKLADFAA